MERVLRALGWRFLRQGGSHEIWINGIDVEAIPRHFEINENTAKAIIKRVRNRPPEA
ncbi:MAG: type II toxin-antitoxin system HicA family toxin [Pseudomonadota bacterium]